MKIGITGHQRFKTSAAWVGVRAEIERLFSGVEGSIIGLTSLAIGADQVFADAVLQRGGSIEAIIPFEGYELKFDKGRARDAYRRLLDRAAKVETLRQNGTEEEAYFNAGKRVVDLSDQMIAVWDGQPSAGLGGTADVVSYARDRSKPIYIIEV